MTELSGAATAICAKHYRYTDPASCNPCPLRPECHNSPTIATHESLAAWRERLNNIAKDHAPCSTEAFAAALRPHP